jgi:hypothetical protein
VTTCPNGSGKNAPASSEIPDADSPPGFRLRQAKKLILNQLKAGPVDSDKLTQQIMAHDISERTVLNARKELRDARKVDCHNPDGKGYRWFFVEEL